ncbi:hypothetical protein FDZ71_06010 [bacterium]|nr:MAG: hypothetical protein FDZ71_06010 [bacterium]
MPNMDKVQLGDATLALLKRGMKEGQTYDARIIELIKAERKLEGMRRLVDQAEKILGTDLCPKDKVGPLAEIVSKIGAGLQ